MRFLELSVDFRWCAEVSGSVGGRFVGSSDGDGPCYGNARGRGGVAAAAGGVAAEFVFRVAAGVAAVREGCVQGERRPPSLSSEPKLDHFAPFECRHLGSVTFSSFENFVFLLVSLGHGL